LVQIFTRANGAHDASGAALYGADLSRWPARMVDAQVVINQERIRESNAQQAAEIESAKSGH
jgi:hypothetical protein